MQHVPRSARAVVTAALTVFGILSSHHMASAQSTNAPDVAAGYEHVGSSMNGWSVQGSLPLTARRWSLVGQVDGSYGPDCSACQSTFHDLAGLGGVRFRWSPTDRVSPFWQVQVGTLHSIGQPYFYDTIVGRRFQQKETIDYTLVQPGGGLTVMATRRVGIRGQIDYQFAFHSEGVALFPRATIGAVIRFGR